MKLSKRDNTEAKKKTVAIFSTGAVSDLDSNADLRNELTFKFLKRTRIGYSVGYGQFNGVICNTFVTTPKNFVELQQILNLAFDVLLQNSVLVRKENRVVLYEKYGNQVNCEVLGKKIKACSADIENTSKDYTLVNGRYYVVV